MEEISCVVGEKEHPSWDDLQKMTLLRNCLKEVMRMYVPSGSLYRTIPNDAEIFGYEVPGGVSAYWICADNYVHILWSTKIVRLMLCCVTC